MGFYGNITNTSRTQFQFDRIYSNRVEMDTNKFQDGIYTGRYILIEYDQAANLQLDTFLRVYFSGDKAYTSQGLEENTVVTVGDMKKRENPYVYTADINKNPSNGLTPTECVFYIWKEVVGQGDSDAAKFEYAIESSSNYTINYNIDTKHYGEGRGYDSTVWQKMYIDNIEKYVMIAELNTVVPTFEVSADAPTMNPITPHFDAGSTDVYYKLHYQPQWGFRVKEADESSNEIIYSDDTNVYPSDEEVNYKFATYDPKTGKGETEEVTYPAAIYYNKAGFEPAVRTHYEGYENEISILPTGYSGNKYNNHDGTNSVSEQVDIQELKILLPAIGNMVSDAWDIVYGYNEEDNKRYRDIEWKLVEDAENFEIGGMTRNVHTFAGCINTIHDLIGMIVTKEKPEPTEDEYNKKYIYMTESDDSVIYERILRQPTYIPVDVGEFISKYETFLNTTYPSTQEKNTAYENLFENFQEENYYIKNEKNEYLFINIKALPDYIIAKNNESVQWNGTELFTDGEADYQYIQIQGLEDHLLTILGSLIDCRNLLGTDTPATTDRTTVQGALNALNGIIDRFKSAVPGQFTFVDENGKLISMNWTTKQPFSWINYGNAAQDEADSEIENRFIDLSFNFDEGLINLTHKYNKIEDTTTESNKNLEEGTGNNTGIGNDLQLYTPIVDNAGHVIGHNIETVTLPYGYKIITSTELSSEITKDLYTSITEGTEEVDATSMANLDDEINITIANNTQDNIAINPVNKWIQIKVEDDKVSLAHEIHAIAEVERKSDLNDNGDNIVIQDTVFDAAGHVIENRKHTYTLPYGYKTIKTNGRDTIENEDNDGEVSVTSTTADNTQDTLSIDSGNYWIRADIVNDNVKLSHSVRVINEESNDPTDLNVTNENNINIPDWTFDKAGHVRSKQDHYYTLPFGFKTIQSNGRSANEAENASTVPSHDNIVADHTQDILTINSGNKWIRIDTDTNNDIVVISHDIHNTTSSSKDTDWTKTELNTTIPVTTYNYDTAGHYINQHTENYMLPFNYGKIKGDNDTSTEATATYDELNLISGDSWLETKVTKDTVTFTHTGPIGENSENLQKNNLEPAFGDTFKIEDWYFDDKGHKYAGREHTVKIPQGSLTDNQEDGNIITNLTFIPATGALTTTRDNISNLLLSDYKKNTAKEDIVDTDTLAEALSKLQTQIHNLRGAGEIAEAFDSIKEIADWLKNNDSDADQIIDSIAILNSDNTIKGSVAYAVKQESDRAIEAEQTNTQAINEINNLLNSKIEKTTEFNWGYEEVKDGEEYNESVVQDDGSTIITTYQKYTYQQKQETLQTILEQIWEKLQIDPQGANRIEVVKTEIIPAPEPEVPEEEITT